MSLRSLCEEMSWFLNRWGRVEELLLLRLELCLVGWLGMLLVEVVVVGLEVVVVGGGV